MDTAELRDSVAYATVHLCALRVEEDRIREVYVVNNPDKLRHVPLPG